MKKVLLVLSVIGVFTLASCSKDMGSSVPEELNKCTLTSSEYTSNNNGLPINEKTYYTYNLDHKISRIDYNEEYSTSNETITHNKNSINLLGQRFYRQIRHLYTLNCQLDEKSRISSSTPNTLNKSIYHFKYNPEGFLVEINNNFSDYYSGKDLTDTHSLGYTNGNLTKIVYKPMSLQDTINTSISNISYTTDRLKDDIVSSKIYPYFFSNLTGINNLTAFLGKRSRNLPSKIVTTQTFKNQSVPSTETKEFTYQKDAKGNVISINISTSIIPIERPHITNQVYKFSYQCN